MQLFAKESLLLDRVQLELFSWLVCPVSTAQQQNLTRYLTNSFRRIRTGPDFGVYRLTLSDSTIVVLRATYFSASERLKLAVHLDLNPTRIVARALAEVHRSQPRMHACDGNDNLIPVTTVQAIGQTAITDRIYHTACDAIEEAVATVRETLQRCGLSSACDPENPPVAVQTIEVYRDVFSHRPMDFVSRIRDDFSSCFRASQQDTYDSYTDRVSIDRNCLCLSGKARLGEIYKIYAKSPDAVRYECLFQKKRIRDLCGSNVLASISTDGIRKIAEKLAECSSSFFNGFMSKDRVSDSSFDGAKCLWDLVRSCSTPEIFEEVASLIAVNGKLSSCERFYKTIPKMKEKGLLKKVRYGLYCPSRDTRELLKQLNVLLACCTSKDILDKDA